MFFKNGHGSESNAGNLSDKFLFFIVPCAGAFSPITGFGGGIL